MPSINAEFLPPRLRELIAGDTGSRRLIGSLTPAETELVTTAARGERNLELALSRHRAIGMLPAAGQPQVVIPVLDQIARDASTPRTARLAAVRALGQIATPAVQALLVARVVDADPRVQQETFAALGQFADASALPVLEGLVTPADRAAQKQLELTKALIAHRVGLPQPFLTQATRNPRQPSQADSTRPVVMTAKSAEATTADLARFRGPGYALQFADRSYGLRCGRSEWTMFVNGDLGSITATDRLLSRPWIAALLARWMPAGIATTAQYLVLTRPDGALLHVDVVRTDGEIVYTGSAAPAGTGLSFDISDVARPQTAPTRVVGMLDVDNVRLDVAMVLATRVATERTESARVERP